MPSGESAGMWQQVRSLAEPRDPLAPNGIEIGTAHVLLWDWIAAAPDDEECDRAYEATTCYPPVDPATRFDDPEEEG